MIKQLTMHMRRNKQRSIASICAAMFMAALSTAAVACAGETVVETVVVERVVDREVRVVETVVVDREVVKEVEVPQTVIVEKEVSVPETVVVEKEVLVEVVKEVPLPQTVVVEKEVEVAGETVVQTVEVERIVEVEVEKIVEVERVVTARPGSASTPVPTRQPGTGAVTPTPISAQTVTAVPSTPTPAPPTPTPVPNVPATPTPAPISEINFAGVVTSTNVPSQIQIVFALRDQDGHSVVLPAEEVEESMSVYEQGPGTDGWEEIDYTETSFFVHTAENIDLEVVFVLDFSKSMYEARLPDGRTGIDAMLDAFNAALAVLPPAHRVGVVEFHDRNVDPSVLSPLTTDRATIRSSVARFANSGFDHGSSRVWDGVSVGSKLLSSVSANPQAVRALVFLSDGRDTSSVATRDSLAGIASERKAQLYALGVGDVFQSSELRSLASATGGAYYAAQDVSRLQAQLQLLVNDLRGQYQLSYITLRRAGEYRTRAQLNYRANYGGLFARDLSAEVTAGPFDVASFFGPDNQGVISHDPPSLDRSNGAADVFIRALHIPRNIDHIRFNPGTVKPVSIELVAASDGGLLDGWALYGPDRSGFYDAVSSVPIEFGNSGLLFKLTFSNIVEKGLALPLYFDNTIYAGGKQLAYAGQIHVGEQPRIAFTSNRDGEDSEIYVMNADGTGIVQLTDNSYSDWSPTWSPDGSHIAFWSNRDGEDSEIYVMNADGTGVVQLTDNSATDRDPNWSPDGSRIAFNSYRDGDSEIYVMNANGGGVVQLTNNSVNDHVRSWSPDGRRLAFNTYRHGETGEIYVMNADGTGILRLTDNSVYDGVPAWSPDGNRIAFSSERDGDREIYVMNADGNGVVQLTDNSAYDWSPRWSPDGSRIAFQSDRDGDSEIYVMNADGSGIVQLTDNSSSEWAPSWSP